MVSDQDWNEISCVAPERALDLIGETRAWLDGVAGTAATAAAKVSASLRGLETYVSGQAGLIIDYAEARRDGEPISTATTEGTAQWLPHRRMGANQQMRWSPRSAHQMLKVRTAVANGTRAADHPAGRSVQRRRSPLVLDGLSCAWAGSVPCTASRRRPRRRGRF